MTIAEEFAAAYQRNMAVWPGARLAPTAVAAAMVELTDADGVGLSVFDTYGDPVLIGASCADSTLAERLQFTVGQGPCYHAHRTGAAVLATEAGLADNWPTYHDLLVTQTAFRSVAAMPLRGPMFKMAAIDLLFHDPRAAPQTPLPLIAVLCHYVTAALIEADLIGDDERSTPPPGADDGGPVWLSSPTGVARGQVMVAAGMLVDHLGVSAAAAVKILKARAYSTHTTTDDVAAALVAGHITTAAFD